MKNLIIYVITAILIGIVLAIYGIDLVNEGMPVGTIVTIIVVFLVIVVVGGFIVNHFSNKIYKKNSDK